MLNPQPGRLATCFEFKIDDIQVSIMAEVLYRRRKAAERDYEALLTDDLSYLRKQADFIVSRFGADFGRASKILDVGAGTCWFADHLHRKYSKNVVSLDVSAEVMALSEPLHGFRGVQIVGEVGDLAMVNKRYDIVCCSALLHHVADLPKFYRDVGSVLRSNGLFIAFNEPRSPSFPPLRLLHEAWFGRDPRRFGILDLPRTGNGYLRGIPMGLHSSLDVDLDKTERNYRAVLGGPIATIYSLIAGTPRTEWIRDKFFAESIILTIVKGGARKYAEHD